LHTLPVYRSTPDSRPDRTTARFGTALGCCVTCYKLLLPIAAFGHAANPFRWNS
jgi:hypothetical protein